MIRVVLDACMHACMHMFLFVCTESIGAGFVSNAASISNVVIFSLCRKGMSPISMHALLIGEDCIKSFRMCYELLECLWLDLLLGCILRLFAVSVHLSWLSFGVYCMHALLGLCYLLLSQIVRVLSLRRQEIKKLLSSLVASRPDDLKVIRDDDTDDEGLSPADKPQKNKQYAFFTLADLSEYYARDGFISSPGSVFPSII